jgi:hypothetical protein
LLLFTAEDFFGATALLGWVAGRWPRRPAFVRGRITPSSRLGALCGRSNSSLKLLWSLSFCSICLMRAFDAVNDIRHRASALPVRVASRASARSARRPIRRRDRHPAGRRSPRRCVARQVGGHHAVGRRQVRDHANPASSSCSERSSRAPLESVPGLIGHQRLGRGEVRRPLIGHGPSREGRLDLALAQAVGKGPAAPGVPGENQHRGVGSRDRRRWRLEGPRASSPVITYRSSSAKKSQSSSGYSSTAGATAPSVHHLAPRQSSPADPGYPTMVPPPIPLAWSTSRLSSSSDPPRPTRGTGRPRRWRYGLRRAHHCSRVGDPATRRSPPTTGCSHHRRRASLVAGSYRSTRVTLNLSAGANWTDALLPSRQHGSVTLARRIEGRRTQERGGISALIVAGGSDDKSPDRRRNPAYGTGGVEAITAQANPKTTPANAR